MKITHGLVGLACVFGLAACSSVPISADGNAMTETPDRDFASELAALRAVFNDGKGTDVEVTTVQPMDMLEDYVSASYPSDASDFEYVEGATAFETDVNKVGTVDLEVAIEEARADAEQWYGYLAADATDDVAAEQQKAEDALRDLGELEAIFGFDGWWKSCLLYTSPSPRDS